jgi:hypothetical protein
LAGYGIAGILIACLILTSLTLLPSPKKAGVLLGVSVGDENLSEMEGPEGIVYSTRSDFAPNWTVITNVTVYDFSEPLGPGSEANLSITVESWLNFSETFNLTVNLMSGARLGVTASEMFPDGVFFLDGGFEWSWVGEIEANGTRTFNHAVRATGVGLTLMLVKTNIPYRETAHGWVGLSQRVDMFFFVLPDNVFVYSDYPFPPNWVTLDALLLGWHRGGVGTEFNYSVRVSGSNVTGVVLKLVMQEGVTIVDGQTVWIGNETAEHAGERIRATLRFDQVGIWFVYAYVARDGVLLYSPKAIQFAVSENNSTAYEFLP